MNKMECESRFDRLRKKYGSMEVLEMLQSKKLANIDQRKALREMKLLQMMIQMHNEGVFK